MDVWQMVDAERQRLNERLAALSEDDWERESLAAGWTVKDVCGHLIALMTMSVPKFVAGMARSRLSFEGLQEAGRLAAIAGRTPADIREALASLARGRGRPPGPKLTVLGEVLVHSEDITRAVGGSFGEHPIEHVEAVADFYKRNTFPLKVKARIDGVTLRMTDSEWSYGSGPEVSGPGIAILMAMVGRKIALENLSGEGRAVLESR